jgi:N-carbamoyl-L-amino-acid hydrolase
MTTVVQRLRGAPRCINGDRLLARIDELRCIGATAGGGVSRPAFGPADVRARELVACYMREAGLSVRVDAAANLLGSRAGTDPRLGAIVLGSHLDTVPDGGALDGAYGVLAAVEVAHTLHEHRIRLDHPVLVAAFSNEEGIAGSSAMFGSRAAAGAVGREELATEIHNGRTLAALVDGAGGDSVRLDSARWDPSELACYLELHIEQGPVLQNQHRQIGVVTAITGRLTIEIVITGEANHGGTTPMNARRDALVAGARMVLVVRELAASAGVVRVATVGSCTTAPGAWNVVPGEVRLVVDVRDVDDAAISEGVARLRTQAHRVAAETGASIDVTPLQFVAPASCDERVHDAIAGSAADCGLTFLDMPSGAGHDAQWIADITPMGMIFVPSRDGISHSPREWSAPADLVNGANVLLGATLTEGGAARVRGRDQ